jgi:hypothetical protein
MSRKKVHHGLHTYRFKDNPEEKAFALAWQKEQVRPLATPLLVMLLGNGCEPAVVSDRDHEVAATVIQWLGSPVGQAFLQGLGYEKKGSNQ